MKSGTCMLRRTSLSENAWVMTMRHGTTVARTRKSFLSSTLMETRYPLTNNDMKVTMIITMEGVSMKNTRKIIQKNTNSHPAIAYLKFSFSLSRWFFLKYINRNWIYIRLENRLCLIGQRYFHASVLHFASNNLNKLGPLICIYLSVSFHFFHLYMSLLPLWPKEDMEGQEC